MNWVLSISMIDTIMQNKVNFSDNELPVQGGYCNPDGSFNPDFK